MTPPRPIIRWPDRKPRSVPIPQARDPFVNVELLRLTPGPDGSDRFWISSYNAAVGSLGVCVNELGDYRLYPFGSFRLPGFYSAVQTEPNILWLCGNLAQLVRLDLQTGKFDVYETGAPGALMFAGMTYSQETGKLFFVAFPPPKTIAVSFNVKTCRAVRVYDLPSPDHYQRSSHAHADGAHTVVLHIPGLTMLRWNPNEESVTVFSVLKTLEPERQKLLAKMIEAPDGRIYLPSLGWYDPKTGNIHKDGMRPTDDTVCWFDRDSTFAYGLKQNTSILKKWNLKTGEVSHIGDYSGIGLNTRSTCLTRSGKLATMSAIGVFSRLNPATGDLELSREIPTNSVQGVDCAIRIDKERILGTPFITQRFWEANLRTKKGFDCGAAAPGSGEILRVWRLGGKIYMAAYTGGELVEYDPSEYPRFPENPRVVAKPLTGMRPVASADDGRNIFYSCSHHYGHLGSILIKYDTRSGIASYKDNPIPDQQIISLFHDKKSNSLLAATTYEADCCSVPANSNRTVIARFDAKTFETMQFCPGPKGAIGTRLIGPMGKNLWFGVCWGNFGDSTGSRWFAFDAESFRAPTAEDLNLFEKCSFGIWGNPIQYAGKPGRFVIKSESRIELWDMNKNKRLKVFGDSEHLGHFFVQGQDLLMWSAWDMFVLEKALA